MKCYFCGIALTMRDAYFLTRIIKDAAGWWVNVCACKTCKDKAAKR